MKALLLLTLTLLANAEDRKVFLFGGNGSTHSQMAPCYPGVTVLAMDEAYGKIKGVADEINKNPDKKYTVAAHSNGSAWLSKVAPLLKNPDQVRFINLDGLEPDAKEKPVKDTVCWTSTDGKGMKGKNLPNMRQCKTLKTYTAPQCQTQWCLHFSLVNTNVPGDLHGDGDWARRGYNNCAGNTVWLSP